MGLKFVLSKMLHRHAVLMLSIVETYSTTCLLYQMKKLFYAAVSNLFHTVQEVASLHAFLACQLQLNQFKPLVSTSYQEGLAVDL